MRCTLSRKLDESQIGHQLSLKKYQKYLKTHRFRRFRSGINISLAKNVILLLNSTLQGNIQRIS